MNPTLQYDGGLQTVIPLQLVYLDFDGEQTRYRGEILTIEAVTVADSGLTATAIATLTAKLNEQYAGRIRFVTERPKSGDYSTVFVGHTDAFAFRGLSETIDHGNQIANDNAFVNLRGDETEEQIQQTIAHEVDHLTGTLDHGGEALTAYAYRARYDVSSGVTSSWMRLNQDSMYIFNGGVADHTTVDYNCSMLISSGGVANHTEVNNGGYVYLSSGGVANTTKVNEGGLQVYNGGVANNTTVHSSGWMYIDSDGVANSTTVNSGGSMFITSGGSALNINWTPCVGKVDAADGAYVTYTRNYSGCYLGSNQQLLSNAMTMSGKVVVGSIYVFSGGIANSTAINYGGYLYLSSGGVANSTAVNNGGNLYLSSGGVASNTVVNSSGRVIVFNGGTANGAKINSYGSMLISNGGSALNINWTPCEGNVHVADGAYVTYASTYSGCYFGSNQQLLSSAITMSGKIVAGSMYVFSGGTVNSTTVNFDGTMFLSSGGVANSITVNSGGAMVVVLGGTANDTVLNSNGSIVISSGGTASIAFNPWQGQNNIESSNGATVTYLERDAKVYYGASATGLIGKSDIYHNAIITSGNSMIVYSGGTATSTTVNSQGWLYISSGGEANHTVVNSYGYITIHSGGVASNTTVNSGAYVAGFRNIGPNAVFIEKIAGRNIVSIVNNLSFSGNMPIGSGGVANNTTVHSGGTMHISRSAVANDTIVYAGGSMLISNGGVANDTIVNSVGYMHVSNGGVANDTIVSSGHVHVSSGGVVHRTIVSNYSELTVFSGGEANDTTLNGNAALPSMFISNGGVANRTTVNAHGTIYICGGVANSTTVSNNGSMTVSSGGVANNTIIYGNLNVSNGGTVNETTVNSRGYMYISSGGVANDTIVKSGYIRVESGGVANCTGMNSGGTMFISKGGCVNNTIIYSGGSQLVYSGGKHCGEWFMEDGAYVMISSGGMIDFTLAGRTAQANALINNFSLIQNSNQATYTISVTAEQAVGRYTLAEGVTTFANSMVIQIRDGNSSSALRVNDRWLDAGKMYTIERQSSSLRLAIAKAMKNPFYGTVAGAPEYLEEIPSGNGFLYGNGVGALVGSEVYSGMVFGGAAVAGNADIFAAVNHVVNNALIVVGGNNNASLHGNIYLKVFADSVIDQIYGGNMGGDHTGNIHVEMENAKANYLYGGASGGVDGNVALSIAGTAATAGIAQEIQGATVNGNVKDGLIDIAGGTFGNGTENFYIHAGVRVGGTTATARSFTQTGSSTINITGGSFQDKSYLFAGGFAFATGAVTTNAKDQVSNIQSGTQMLISRASFTGNASIFGGGRAANAGKSNVTGGSVLNLSRLTLTAGKTLQVYGGGHNDGRGVTVTGGSNILISGTHTIGGKLNLYGGGTGGNPNTAALSVVDHTLIQVGEAATATRITLNNIYGGGYSGAVVTGNSQIRFSGYGQVRMAGILSGDGTQIGTVRGTKTLEFDRFQNQSLGVTALQNFDVIKTDSQSMVSIGSQRLNLDSIGGFDFTLTADTMPLDPIISFDSGVSAWNNATTFAVTLDTIWAAGSYSLIQCGSALNDLLGKAVHFTLGGMEVTRIDSTVGTFNEWNGWEVGLELADTLQSGFSDALQLVIREAGPAPAPIPAAVDYSDHFDLSSAMRQCATFDHDVWSDVSLSKENSDIVTRNKGMLA